MKPQNVIQKMKLIKLGVCGLAVSFLLFSCEYFSKNRNNNTTNNNPVSDEITENS